MCTSICLLGIYRYSRKIFCISIKLFQSPVTSNSSIGPFGLYTGPIFWQKLSSKVINKGVFSNKSNELWVASEGNMLTIIYNFWKEIGPTALWSRSFWNDRSLATSLNFPRRFVDWGSYSGGIALFDALVAVLISNSQSQERKESNKSLKRKKYVSLTLLRLKPNLDE